ncbi:NADH:flavin oxidoreductase/NADH oxidase [Oceanobacillus massiliensis]|uniref:NADH:flavin oxidoreductase/NADH oxidase n=1 Tax=Oceanobacillus massiliensis TaxID=1465765 RepID=UPI003016AFDE
MAMLQAPYTLKGLSLKNRIVMAPMCQYSVEAKDGIPNDWHFVHYVSRAVGGTGLIIIEMTDVDPDGRITDYDLGLWSDEHVPAFRKIVDGVHKQGSKIGIQIAHAGRKAEDANPPVGPSDLPVSADSKTPRALTTEEVKTTISQFKDAARRAVEAGVDTIEIHGAHGYLIHQFHSPGINNREDEYGKDLSKFGVEIIQAVKSVMPEDMPLLMRISAVEYMDGGYGLDHSIEMAKRYKEAGIDMFHISSGGEAAPGEVKPANHPGYQVPFARAFKEALDVPIIAVGILENPYVAEATLANQDAELVAIGRGMLQDAYWSMHALEDVARQVEPPVQYKRAFRKHLLK